MGNRFQRLSRILGLFAVAAGAAGCGLSGTRPPPFSPLDGYAGQVRVSCALMRDGHLTDCRIVNEDPEGAGFREAALLAASRSRVTPGTVDGAAEGARVEYNIRFRPEDRIESPQPADPAPPH